MNKTNFRKFEIENMFGSENAQKSCLQFSACRQRRKLIILSNLIENGIEGLMAVGSTRNNHGIPTNRFLPISSFWWIFRCQSNVSSRRFPCFLQSHPCKRVLFLAFFTVFVIAETTKSCHFQYLVASFSVLLTKPPPASGYCFWPFSPYW